MSRRKAARPANHKVRKPRASVSSAKSRRRKDASALYTEKRHWMSAAALTAFATLSKAAMIPSPVCLTSRSGRNRAYIARAG